MHSEMAGQAHFQRDVRNFIVNNFLFGQPLELQADESLLRKGVIDSTGVLELVAFLEGEYGIKVEDDEVVPENLDSIASVAAYLAKKLSSRS